MRFGDEINFGNVTNSNITIKSKLNNVQQIINAAPITSTQDKAILDALLEQLGKALEAAPVNRGNDVEAILVMVRQLATEASKPQPNKTLVNINANGLKEAAETLKAVAPTVLTIATQIVTHIMKMTGG